MIRGCPGGCHPTKPLETIEQFVLKFTALVMVKTSGKSDSRNKVTENPLRDCLVGLIPCRIQPCESREMLNYHQEVFESSFVCTQEHVLPMGAKFRTLENVMIHTITCIVNLLDDSRICEANSLPSLVVCGKNEYLYILIQHLNKRKCQIAYVQKLVEGVHGIQILRCNSICSQ